MGYLELPAPPQLAPWVACLWHRTGGGAPVRVLPDGCIDLIWIAGEGAHVAGPQTRAFLHELRDDQEAIGARLHPGAAPVLLGVRPVELLDGATALEGPWGADGARAADAVGRAADRPQALAAVLAARAARSPGPDPVIGGLVDALGAPCARLPAIAASLGLSERQLRRRTIAAVGYAPKLLARVLRLRRALAAARRGDDLAHAAFAAGFADQAHFAHDCRELAGAPAGVVLGRRVADSCKTGRATEAMIPAWTS